MSCVWLVGTAGRTPFVGHVRGARTFDSVRLAWAARVAGTASVVDGWEAAQAARDALADLRAGGDPAAVLAEACAALRRLDARWLDRGDMSVLLVATDAGGAFAAGSGLGGVYGRNAGAWRPLVPPDHPLLGEPGVPDGSSFPVPSADVWVGVPAGLPLPGGDIATACGVHP